MLRFVLEREYSKICFLILSVSSRDVFSNSSRFQRVIILCVRWLGLRPVHGQTPQQMAGGWRLVLENTVFSPSDCALSSVLAAAMVTEFRVLGLLLGNWQGGLHGLDVCSSGKLRCRVYKWC